MKTTLTIASLLLSFSTFAGYNCAYLSEKIVIEKAASGEPFVVGNYSNKTLENVLLEGKLTETKNEYFYTVYKYELMDAKGEKALMDVNVSLMSGGRACKSPRACGGMNAERVTANFSYLGKSSVMFCQKTKN